jgi:hypothetical protein
MPVTVRLDDIVDALDTLVDESPSYLDLDTGQVVSVSEELLSEAEEPGNEDPELLDWQKDEWEIAKRIASTDRFLELPTQFDVHEWEIMQDFSRSADNRNSEAGGLQREQHVACRISAAVHHRRQIGLSTIGTL